MNGYLNLQALLLVTPAFAPLCGRNGQRRLGGRQAGWVFQGLTDWSLEVQGVLVEEIWQGNVRHDR